MSVVNLSFPEKYYVGVKAGEEFSTTEYPLSFATPFGTDSAFQKRKETVDNWCGVRVYNYQKREYEDTNPGYEPKVVDNVPLEGFQLEKVVSRYSTSNKMYRINDPRGFTVEISTENLCDILLNCVIDHGTLVGKFIWGREGGKNYLTRLDHPSYQDSLEEKISRSLKVGDIVRLGADKLKHVFVGTYYFASIEAIGRYQHTASGRIESAAFYYRPTYDYATRTHSTEYTHVYLTCLVKDEKPYQVFKRLEGYRENHYILYRKISKPDIVGENVKVEELEFGKFAEYNTSMYGSDVRTPFYSKQELLNFSPDLLSLGEIFNKVDSYRNWNFVGYYDSETGQIYRPQPLNVEV
jgi:hypothetical protein